MSNIIGKDPKDLTQTEITWLVNVADAAVTFIQQGQTTKAKTVLTDIATHFAQGAPAPTPTPEGEVASPETPCSQCHLLLPNEAAYLECMADCTS
jgi:hypothetical protein